MGFGTPAGKALGVRNSEGAASHWYRIYSSFLVMLVHFFSAVVRGTRGASRRSRTPQLLYSFTPAPACRASPSYLGRGRKGCLFISEDPPALLKCCSMDRLKENASWLHFSPSRGGRRCLSRAVWEGAATPALPRSMGGSATAWFSPLSLPDARFPLPLMPPHWPRAPPQQPAPG